MKNLWIGRAVFVSGIAAIMLSCAPGTRESASMSPPRHELARAQHRAGASSVETPAPAESNPPGDIPDSQAFVRYTSTMGHYAVDAPEGWSRTITNSSVEFRDKYDGESVRLMLASGGSIGASAAASIQRASHAAHIRKITTTAANGQSQTMISFTSNSDANPVTGRKIRLDNEAILYSSGKRVAILTLWAPSGSDNADQWNRIARSFRWQ